MSKLKELDMHCGNCPDDLYELCEIYTPAKEVNVPLCCQSELSEYDTKDIEGIENWCKEAFTETEIRR